MTIFFGTPKNFTSTEKTVKRKDSLPLTKNFFIIIIFHPTNSLIDIFTASSKEMKKKNTFNFLLAFIASFIFEKKRHKIPFKIISLIMFLSTNNNNLNEIWI